MTATADPRDEEASGVPGMSEGGSIGLYGLCETAAFTLSDAEPADQLATRVPQQLDKATWAL
jgi:hypothetical protein